MERYFENITRYAELFTKRGEQFWIEDDKIYRLYQQMINPEGAIKKNLTIDLKKGKKLLTKSKGILLRQTYNFDCNASQSEWYAIICKKHIPIERLNSNKKRGIIRGLQNCTVRMITPKELASQGFECYSKAFENYKSINVSIFDEIQFKHNIINAEGFEDIVHYWGVYKDDKLIAYASNYIFGNTEVSYTTAKLHPDYLECYPMYALIYKMNEYYLQEQQFEYVNAGFRSILHETTVQSFLISKFDFKKVYLDLNVQYQPLYGFVMKFTFPFRKIIAKFDARFKALFELEQIHRISKK
ncbi:MAG: hypothetical protein WCP69_02240 [Bacteroidota bacterium]